MIRNLRRSWRRLVCAYVGHTNLPTTVGRCLVWRCDHCGTLDYSTARTLNP